MIVDTYNGREVLMIEPRIQIAVWCCGDVLRAGGRQNPCPFVRLNMSPGTNCKKNP